MKTCLVSLLLLVVMTTGAFALDVSEWERVLLPVSITNVPGAYGSLWTTDFWIYNRSTDRVQAMLDNKGASNKGARFPVVGSIS